MFKFYFYAHFSNGDKCVEYYDAAAFTEAITSGLRDINNHPVMKDLKVTAIFCAMVTPQNEVAILALQKEKGGTSSNP